MLLLWNGAIWVTATQRHTLTEIGSYEQNSCIIPYGTDGSALYKLFAQPDPALEKKISSKAYRGPNKLTTKNWACVYVDMQDKMGGPEGVSITGTQTTAGGGIPNGVESLSFDVAPGQDDCVPKPTAGGGISAAIDLRSLSPDFVIERVHLMYREDTLFGA
jgi:hypothetical protein